MKLHIPLKLLAALLACVMHTSFAAGVVTIPDNATDAQIAVAKYQLSTPTLTWLYNQNPSTFPTTSSYQLVEVTEDVAASDFTITKYLKNVDNKNLTPVTYNVEFNEAFGDPVGFDSYYYTWSVNAAGYTTLVMTTSASNADVTYTNHYQADNVQTTGISVSSSYSDRSDINTSFKGCSGISNSGSIGYITGDFIGNIDTNNYQGGAIYNAVSSTISGITGDFIGNYSYCGKTAYSTSYYSTGGAIFNYGIIGSIIGDFVGNYSSGNLNTSYGGAIANGGYGSSGSRKIGDITGDFIANYSTAPNAYSSGGAIWNYNSCTIGNIIGDFIANYSTSYSTSRGGAIYNDATSIIGNITGDFIANYAYSSNGSGIGGAIYNSGSVIGDICGDFILNQASYGAAIYSISSSTIGSITGDFIENSAKSLYGGAIYNSASEIGDITGDFLGNNAKSSYGAAIYNRTSGVITSITGDFIGNYLSASSDAYGSAIYNAASISEITGDFINNYINSSSTASGGGIYIASTGSITSITGDFIGNTLTSTSMTYGGAIYNAGTVTLLADDDSILFNDNFAAVGEALFNSGTSYLYAFDGYDITFNDTIYNSGATANIIIGKLDSSDYTGSVVLNATLSGSSTANVTLASGTLEFGNYTDDDGETSYGNITGTKLTITGGAISTVDNSINVTDLGYLTLTAEATNWSLDLDLSNQTADTLTVNSVSGTGVLMLDSINLLGSSDEDSITVTLTTNYWLMSSISTDTAATNFLINGENSSDYSSVTYDATTGQLTISTVAAVSLDDMVASSDDIKQYQLTKDELVSDNLGVLGGTSLSIFGQGFNIMADGDDIAGITIDGASQTLTISDVAAWSGFSGDAVTNNAGTLIIKASAYDSTWSNSIKNNADMSVLAAAEKTVTFDEAVTGTGALTLNDADNSGSIIFNDDLTQAEIKLNGGSVSFAAAVSGNLTMTGGSLSLSTGAVVDSDTVTVQAGSLSLDKGASLTVDGALSASGMTIANAGELCMGEGSVIGSITSAGTNTVTGDATIGSLDATSSLVISGADTTLTLQSNTTLASLTNLGTVDASGFTLTLTETTTGGTVLAKSLVLTGDNSFTSITADSVDNGTGTLTVTSDLNTSLSNLGTVDASGFTLTLAETTTGGTVLADSLVLTGDNSFTSITADSVDNGTGTLTVTSDLNTSLTNLGTVDASGFTLTLADTTTGGTALADSLVLTGDNSFTKLTVGDVSNTGILTLGDGSSIATLSAGSLVTSGTVTLGSLGSSQVLSVTGDLTLGGVATGGTLNATGDVVLAEGDNVFTQLTAGAVTNTGALTLGNGSNIASLSAGSLVTTGTVTLGSLGSSQVLSVTGGLTLGSVANGGTLNASGDVVLAAGDNVFTQLTAADVTNTGALSLGDGSSITTLSAGSLVTTGTVTLGSLGTSQVLAVTGDLTLGSATTGGTLNASGDVVLAAGDNVFTQLTAADVTNTGALTLGDGSSIATLSAGSLVTSGTVTLGSLGSSQDLTVTGGLTLGNAANGGTLNATGDVVLAAGDNVFTQLTAGAVTNTGALTLGNGSNIASLSAGSLVTTGTVTLGSLGASQDLDVTGGLTLGSVAAGGTLNATGDVVLAAGDNVFTQLTAGAVTNTGALTLGDGSNIASLSAGSLVTNGAVTLGSLGDTQTLSVTGGLTLGNAANGGTLNATGDVVLASGANAFTQLTADAVANTGALTLGDGSNIATLTGGSLVTTGTVTLGSLGDVQVLGVTGGLTLGSVAAGGTLNATGDVVLAAGDNVFTQFTAADVTNTGALTLGNGSSIATLTGGSLVTSGTVTLGSLGTSQDLTVTGGLTLGSVANGGTLNATGSVILANGANSFTNLGSGGDLTLDSALSVSNTLTLGGSLILSDSLSLDSAVVSAGSLVANNGLNLVIDSDVLDSLNFTTSTSYELISLDTAFAGDLTLNGLSSYALEDGYSIVLVSAADGSIQLQLATMDNYWTSTDGTWGSGNSLDWTQGEPSSSVAAVFYGQGTETVKLVGEQTVGSTIINSATQDYTFTGDQLNTGTLQVQAGGLDIGNDVVVSSSASVSDAASLDVLEGGSLTILGALYAEGQTIGNAGDLSVGAGSVIGSITGSGTNTVTGNATIGSLDSASSLVIEGADTTLTLQSDTTLAGLDNAGTMNLAGNDLTLTAATSTGGTVIADDITLTGDNSFTSITATGNVSGSDKLTLNADSSIEGSLSTDSLEITAGDVNIGSISGALSSLNNGTGTLNIDSNLTVTGTFNNDGTLDMAGYDLTLGTATTNGGTVIVANITMTGNNTFDSLTVTGSITTDGDLELGAGSDVGHIGGTGTTTVTGDTDIDSMAEGGKLVVEGDDTTATVGSNTSLGSLDNDGTLDLGDNKLTLESATDNGGDVIAGELDLTGDNIFDSVSISGNIDSDGKLTVSDDSSAGSLTGGGSLDIDGADTEFIIKDDTTLSGLDNEGTLNLGDNKLTLTGSTSNGGHVIAGDLDLTGDNIFDSVSISGNIDSDGKLTVSDDSSAGSLTGGGSLDIDGADTEFIIKDDTTLSGLDNEGTLNLGDNKLTLTGSTSNGGHVIAGDLDLTGDNIFDSVSISGNIDSEGKLTVSDDSSTGSLTGGGSLVLNDGANFDITGTGSTTLTEVSGTGSLSTAGDLILSNASTVGALSITGDATLVAGTSVTGALELGGSLSITGDLTSTEPALSAGSLVTGGSLDIILTDAQLSAFDWAADSSYELISLDTAYAGSLTLNGSDSYNLEAGYNLSLVVDANGDIQLQLVTDDNYWVSTDGVWGNSSSGDWTTGEPSSSINAVFNGKGSDTVTLTGTQTVSSTIINSSTQDYSFTGDKLITSSLQIIEGSLSIGNEVEVKASASISSTGSLTIEEGGSLAVAGALSAADATITSEGSLSFGAGSVVGDITHISNITYNSSSSVTITGSSTVNSLDVYALTVQGSGTVLTLNQDSSVTSLNNEGTINAGENTLTVHSNIENGGTVYAGNLFYNELTPVEFVSFDSLYVTGRAVVTKLTLNGNSVIGDLLVFQLAINSGEVTIGKIDGVDLEYVDTLFIGDEATLTINSDFGVLSRADSTFTSYGLLDVGSNNFDLGVYTSSGGSITAGTLILGEGGEFDAIITDLLELGTIGNPYLRSSSYVLTVDSISSMSGGLIELELSSLSSSTVDATYQLIASTGDDLSWSSFKLSDATVAIINELTINEGKEVSYLVEDGNLSLSIADAPVDSTTYTWDTANELAFNADGTVSTPVMIDGQLASYDVLDKITQVNVSTSVELDLTELTPDNGESVLISNMYGFADATLSIVGDGADADSVTLFNDTMTVAQNAVSVEDSTLIVDNAGSDVGLSFGALELDSATLTVLDGASLRVDSIDSSATSVIEGDVSIVGDESSKLLGSYVAATLNFQTSASALIYIADAAELSLEGTSANIQLISASGNAINSFDLTDSTLTVGSISDGESLTIAEVSSMTGGTLSITVADSIIGAGSTTALITGASLSLDGTTISVSTASSALDISNFDSSTSIELFTLSDDAVGEASVELSGGSLSKYFTNATYVNGKLYADLNTNSYGSLAQTGNGAAGLGMMSSTLVEINPQLDANREQYPDLADALDGLDAFKSAGSTEDADKLGAAIAGASTTSLGSAALADVSRQLRSMRSRSKNAGLANDTILAANASAWVSAEGGNSSLSDDGTSAGHDWSVFGGSVGAELNLSDAWRAGIAFTSVQGDVSSAAADRGEGDLTNNYVSIYANMRSERWSHNFVATMGMIDASMERTVTTNTSGDYYKTKGDTDGSSFALGYELGYGFDLNEEATSTIQALFAISYINSSISGYTESNSDAALHVGTQDNSYVTVGFGAQYDTIVGGSIYNRESLLSARAMLNVDAGDRAVEADVSLVNGNGDSYTIKGAEPGAVGLELGLGLDVPVSESSSLFVDFSCEFRSKMTDVSGGVGYRISF